MLDILIKDAMVVDGTGGPAFKADVGIAEGRVVALGQAIEQEAGRVIDAQGLHLAPGFVDPHTHSDISLLADRLAESKVRQGVTTDVIGNCGFSPAPALGAAHDEVQASAATFGVDVTWSTMGEYLDSLRNPGIAMNVVALVGHNEVGARCWALATCSPPRSSRPGWSGWWPSRWSKGRAGCPRGSFTRPVSMPNPKKWSAWRRSSPAHNGTYASHIRSESDQLLESIAEVVDVGQKAGVQVEVAHLKLSGYRNWGDIDRLLSSLEEAEAAGVRLGCDQYPYHASSTWLGALLPYPDQAGGAKAVARRLADPEVRRALRADWEANPVDWDNRSGVRDWDGILVSECLPRPEAVGKTVAQLAEEWGQDPLDVVFDLIVVSEGQASAVWFDQSEENVVKIMRHPLVAVGSDGYAMAPRGMMAQRQVHPRSYGTFPRVLGRYVREEQVLTLEEAVKKMTSMTAQRFGLEDRGVVREGAWADLVLFDGATVADRATFTDSHQFPVGIPYVLVNGALVIADGRHTGALPGRVL